MNEPELQELATTYLHRVLNPKRHSLIDDIIQATFRRIRTTDAYRGGDVNCWFYRVLATTMLATIRAERQAA